MTVKEFLAKEGLSYDAFGQMVGVTATSIYRYIAGIRRPEEHVADEMIKVSNGLITRDGIFSVPRRAG